MGVRIPPSAPLDSVASLPRSWQAKEATETSGVPSERSESRGTRRALTRLRSDQVVPVVFCVYVLRCSDRTLYVGHTNDLDRRLQVHNAGHAVAYRAGRRPVRLVYTERCGSQEDAVRRERQLKRWSGKKKEALIAGDVATLKRLSRRRRPKQ